MGESERASWHSWEGMDRDEKAREERVTEILVQMLALFDGGKRWTKRTFARDYSGRACSYSESDAKRFCLLGGLRRVVWERDLPWLLHRAVVARLSALLPGQPVDRWNDAQKNFGTVRALLIAAIEDGK